MLTTFDLNEYVYEALRAGASGFLLKDVPAEQLVAGVHVVAAGEALLAPTVTRRLIEEFAQARPGARSRPPSCEELTARELEVFMLVARGMSNAEIAAELVVSDATVKTHVARVLMKLDLRDRIQAVVLAYETGLVTPGAPRCAATAGLIAGKVRASFATLGGFTDAPSRPSRHRRRARGRLRRRAARSAASDAEARLLHRPQARRRTIITTKDVTAIKSFQTAVLQHRQRHAERLVHREPQAEAEVGRRLLVHRQGEDLHRRPEAATIAKVTITASFKNGRYKGTATFPKGYACKPANFCGEVLRRQPRGLTPQRRGSRRAAPRASRARRAACPAGRRRTSPGAPRPAAARP